MSRPDTVTLLPSTTLPGAVAVSLSAVTTAFTDAVPTAPVLSVTVTVTVWVPTDQAEVSRPSPQLVSMWWTPPFCTWSGENGVSPSA
jgi:hypothetical protein